MLDNVKLAMEQREELLRKLEEIDTSIMSAAFEKDLKTKSLSELVAQWLPGYKQVSKTGATCLQQTTEASLREAIRRAYNPSQFKDADDRSTIVERMKRRAAVLTVPAGRSLFRRAFQNSSDIAAVAA